MSEETTTRERSTTTALMMTEMTYEQLVESQLTKLLYLIHGTGSDRDRTIQLSTLRKWILEGVNDAYFDDLTVAHLIAMANDTISTMIAAGQIVVQSTSSSSTLSQLGLVLDGTQGQVTRNCTVDPDGLSLWGGQDIFEVKRTGFKASAGSDDQTAVLARTGLVLKNGTQADSDQLTLSRSGITGKSGGVDFEISKNKVETAQIRLTSIVEVTTTYDGLSQQEQVSGNPKVGDIVQVWNKGTQGVKVYLNHTTGGGGSTYVTINAGCCIPFICVQAASAQVYSDWAPQANLQIYNES